MSGILDLLPSVKFALLEDKKFNHIASVNIFYSNSKPIHRVTKEITHYQSALEFQNTMMDSTGQKIRLCWIEVYFGPLDMKMYDTGKQVVANIFQTDI